MRRRRVLRRLRGKLLFATVLGISDGILNSLTLAAATVLKGVGLSVGLGLRIGVVALVSAWFTLFVAEYAQYRLDLADAERQLMFTRSGRLAATNLGRAVVRDALAESTAAAVASFAGASLPLVVGALLPTIRLMALVMSIVVLGTLGVVLATNVNGRHWIWALGLVLAGVVVTLVGLKVDLV